MKDKKLLTLTCDTHIRTLSPVHNVLLIMILKHAPFSLCMYTHTAMILLSSSSSSSPSHSYPEHRSSTISFHRFRFGATLSNFIQFCPSFLIYDSTLLLHVFLGLPRRRVPGGFHFNACLVLWSFCFLSVCPIQVHFLLPSPFPLCLSFLATIF